MNISKKIIKINNKYIIQTKTNNFNLNNQMSDENKAPSEPIANITEEKENIPKEVR